MAHIQSTGVAERTARPVTERENARAWRADPDREVETPFYGFDTVRLCSNHGDQVDGHYTAWLRDHSNVPPESLVGPANAIPDERYSAPQAWRTVVWVGSWPDTRRSGPRRGGRRRANARGGGGRSGSG